MTSQIFLHDTDSQSFSDDMVLVGGGPRSAMQLNSEIVFMLIYQKHFEELANLGAHYDISTTIIETQKALGVGHAYNNGQTGMMNTGVESDIKFPVPIPADTAHPNSLLSLLSYKERFEQVIQGRHKEYYEFVKSVNLPGAVMFKSSLGPASTSAGGELEHRRAYLLRTTVGVEEAATAKYLMKMANVMLPIYKTRVLTSSWAHSVMLNKNEKPSVIVQQADGDRSLTLPADNVRLNCGTLLQNPISDGSARELTFCESMNTDRFREFCASRNLLDRDGHLKSGAKFISGGMSLSGLDQLSVLDNAMNLFEEDDSLLGYRVREEAKYKYKDSITLISRTNNNICVPRVSFTNEWLQGTNVLGDVKHLHALFLHNHGEEVYRTWMMIIRCAVARSKGLTVDEAGMDYTSAEEHLRVTFAESMHHLKCRKQAGKYEKHGDLVGKSQALKESTRTLCGAWRQATLGTYFGTGLHSNPQQVMETMSEFAPITWKGRASWLYSRAQMAALTDPSFALKTSNEKYVKQWQFLMKSMIASPVETHCMMHLLVEAGIARHEQASYGDMEYDSSEGKLRMNGNLYDALVVSPLFDRKRDEAAKSISRQVKLYDDDNQDFGTVGKMRRYVDEQGKGVAVEDHGLGGMGFNVVAADGGRSVVGRRAWDVNNRISGTSLVPSLTLRRMASAHLSAAGINPASKVIDEIYESGKATHAAYEEEVEKFRDYFVEASEICAYLHAITSVCENDAERFAKLYDAGNSVSRRVGEIEKLMASEVPRDRQAANMYYASVSSIPGFNPPSRDDYLARFVDLTDDEASHVYEESRNIARVCLEKN